MKIILVRPKYKSSIITPPLGIGYISAYLKQHGIETKIIDGLREGIDNKQMIMQIISEKPDAVGITCLTAFYNEVVELAKYIKQNNIKCIIGGIHPTFLPYKTLEDSRADYVVCGEGEIAFLKLIKNNFVNKNIQGVYSLDNIKSTDKIIKKAEIIEDLNTLPFPDWEQINPNFYPLSPHQGVVKSFPIGNIITSRGCPYQCTFCASANFYDRRIRFRSPENVFNEITFLKENFGVKEIHFEDDNLTLQREHIKKICYLIIKNNIKIDWACPNGVRADKVDEEMVQLMKKSGCYCLSYGIESADKGILKNIKKMETIEEIERAIEITHKAGIFCQGFFIFGLPGETKETFKKTISFAKNSKLSRASFLLLNVIPGSELWDKLAGKFKPNWKSIGYREPEWLPDGMSSKELMKAQTKAFRCFYFRPKIFFTIARQIKYKEILSLLRRLREYRIIR